MKFKFGDVAIFEDGFATYKGKVVAHVKRRKFPLFWVKEDWYEINIFEINEQPAMGNMFFPEKKLKKEEEEAKPSLQTIDGGKKDT